MRMQPEPFGKTAEQTPAHLYTLENGGMRAKISTYGAAIVSLEVPDKNNMPVDVVLGFDTLDRYERQNCYIGVVLGRCANRIGGAKFAIDGQEYLLYRNDGPNHLHGGKTGFDKKIWQARQTESGLLLTYLSADGEEGYPGNLTAQVRYCLSDDRTLTIDYQAACDQDTVCSLTNHSYFNLAGHSSGPILNQYIQVFGSSYTVTDENSLPTGEIAPVEGTPLDLRRPTRIGEHIGDDCEQLRIGAGYDQNWVLDRYNGQPRKMAYAYDVGTGIAMTAYTDMPGMQFYTGNHLDGCEPGKGGARYGKRWGFCLESQYFPNALQIDGFQKPILKKGEIYHHTAAFHFDTL